MMANSDAFFEPVPSPYASISLEISHLYLMNTSMYTTCDTALLTSITTTIIIITLNLSVNHICILGLLASVKYCLTQSSGFSFHF